MGTDVIEDDPIDGDVSADNRDDSSGQSYAERRRQSPSQRVVADIVFGEHGPYRPEEADVIANPDRLGCGTARAKPLERSLTTWISRTLPFSCERMCSCVAGSGRDALGSRADQARQGSREPASSPTLASHRH